MIKKVAYYSTLLIIILISFRIYSSIYYPGLNSDNAVTILMVHYFQLPDDLYFWGQDRMGSIIPLVAQIPNKLFSISALYSEAIAHYLILIIGFFAIASFFKTHFVKLLFALMLFLPPSKEIEVTQLTLSIQYMFLFIGMYLVLLVKAENKIIHLKQHLILFLFVLSMIIAVWDSDLAIVSVSIFISLYLLYLIKDTSIRFLFKNIVSYYIIFGLLLGFLFITYAKSTSPIKNNYALLCNPNEILKTLSILFSTLKDIFLFNIKETLTSVYSYLALFTVILMMVFVRKVKFTNTITKRLLVFFILDLFVVFIVIIVSKWTLLNGVPMRYFNCTYISAIIVFLLLFENLDLINIKLNIVKYSLLITVLVGSFGAIYTQVFVWYKPYKPYSEYVSELNKLGKIGIVGEYWNSYICSINDPENIKSNPHDKSCVRNLKLVDEVFKQKKIYLIKDMWLDSYPDTILQFGRTLIKQEEPFSLANATLCRYSLVGNTNP